MIVKLFLHKESQYQYIQIRKRENAISFYETKIVHNNVQVNGPIQNGKKVQLQFDFRNEFYFLFISLRVREKHYTHLGGK